MTIPQAATALLRIWPDDLSAEPGQQAGTGTCIETSKIAQRSLARFGVQCKVMAVDLWLGNRYAVPLRDVPLAMWPQNAWSIGVISSVGPLVGRIAKSNEPGRKTGFNGHVVVVGEDWIIDMTAPQFDRPKQEIYCGGAIVLDGVPGVMGRTPMEVVVGMPGGGEGVYRTRPELAAFRRSNAWRDNTDTTKFVDIISDGIRGVMEDEDAAAAAGR